MVLGFFVIYGVRAYIHDIKHRIAHSKEVTITTAELEKIVEQEEAQFLTEDEWLIEKLAKEYYEACSIETLLHELFHAYQYACMREVNLESDLLLAREIEEWRAESEHINNDFYSNEERGRYLWQLL